MPATGSQGRSQSWPPYGKSQKHLSGLIYTTSTSAFSVPPGAELVSILRATVFRVGRIIHHTVLSPGSTSRGEFYG